MTTQTPRSRPRKQPAPLVRLSPDDQRYPASLRGASTEGTQPTLSAIGNLDLLRQPALALFCSVRCPGRLILETYDLAQALRDAGVAVVGGFHSPMEQECQRLLLRGRQPIVICPARSIERLRPPEEWRTALEEGRLLVLSPFEPRLRRATAELAFQRNRLVAALAERVFVAYAAPGSKTEGFARDVAGSGKTLLTLDAPENAALVALGARPIRPATFREEAAPVDRAPSGPPGAVPLPLFSVSSGPADT